MNLNATMNRFAAALSNTSHARQAAVNNNVRFAGQTNCASCMDTFHKTSLHAAPHKAQAVTKK